MGLSPSEVRAMSLADYAACVAAHNRAHAPADASEPETLDADKRARLKAALEAASHGAH